MSNLILSNTSGELNTVVLESFDRLTNSFSGPLLACGLPECGFLIQDGNKNTGIYVSNSNLYFYKDICSNKGSSLCIGLDANSSLFITGNGSLYHFDDIGNFSIGALANSSQKGLQVNTDSPTLILKNICSSGSQKIAMINCNNQNSFLINNLINLNQLDLESSKVLVLKGLSCYSQANTPQEIKKSIFLSGNKFGFGSIPSSNYEFNYDGCSRFSLGIDTQKINICGNLNLTNSPCCTGNILNVCGKSRFHETICAQTLNISGNLNITGTTRISGCIYLDCVDIKGVCFDKICGNSICLSNFFTLNQQGLCHTAINGLSYFSNLVSCNFSTLNMSSENICAYNFQSSGHLIVCSLSACPNVIFGSENSIISTGESKSIVLDGNIFVTGTMCSNSGLAATKMTLLDSNEQSNIYGQLKVHQLSCFSDICANSICVNNNYAGLLQTTYICQTPYGSTANCIMSNLNIGLNCNGCVFSKNTPRALGSFFVSQGKINGNNCNGMNLKCITCHSFNVASTNCYVQKFSIHFCEPIKYPFVVVGMGSPANIAATQSNYTTQQLFNAVSGNSAINNSDNSVFQLALDVNGHCVYFGDNWIQSSKGAVSFLDDYCYCSLRFSSYFTASETPTKFLCLCCNNICFYFNYIII